jgi:hypothetical protein
MISSICWCFGGGCDAANAARVLHEELPEEQSPNDHSLGYGAP